MGNLQKRTWKKRLTAVITAVVLTVAPVAASAPVQTYAAVDAATRAEIEASLYNAEYYEKANEDVAVALNRDAEALYQHWLNYGKEEGRNASMVFNAKYYLEVNPEVAAEVGNDYVAAYEHFVNEGLLAGLESSPVFSVKYYLEANTDVATVFNGDYVSAAKHFNENAIAEGRSGSGSFDYTVYRACNTDVEDLYGDYIEGYYIHYINHGRAEGRTGGLAAGGSSDTGSGDTGSGDTGSGDTGSTGTEIDTTAVSYRIFDADFYLDRYPELATTIGTDANDLYLYWLETGISLGQTASPVIIPEEYLERNADVAAAFGDDYGAAIWHFLNDGIYEGRSASYEFDYTVYKYCNTDVVEVFGEDIVGYYFHYVQYGIDENRTARLEVSEPEEETVAVIVDDSGILFELYFNAEDVMTEQRYYDADGVLLDINTVDYSTTENGITMTITGSRGGSISYTYEDAVLRRLEVITEDLDWCYAEVLAEYEDGTIECQIYYVFDYLEETITRTVTEFDAAGELSNAIDYYYNLDGTPYAYIVYEYEAGTTKKIKESIYDVEGTLQVYNLYQYTDEDLSAVLQYDAADVLLKKLNYEAGSYVGYVTYDYAEDGRLMIEEYYTATEELSGYKEYEYHYDGDTLTGWTEQVYDADGVLTETAEYDANGNPIVPDTGDSTEVPELGEFPEITYMESTIMTADVFTSEEEINDYVFEMISNYYYSFGVMAEDISMLHTAEEYMWLYPEIYLEIESLTKYYNGYYLKFKNGKPVYGIDVEHMYAIRTGDTTKLSEQELAAYNELLRVNEELGLDAMETDIEKILAAHDYLVLNVAYDEEHVANDEAGITNESEDCHYVEGTLLNGLAVCSGYASTFRLLMELQGIHCDYITNAGHGWNAVELDGEWYFIDVTWDDPVPDEPGRLLHTYFMVPEEVIIDAGGHDGWSCECGVAHVCDSTEYMLYPVQEYVFTTEEEAKTVIQNQADLSMVTMIYPSDGTFTQDGLIDLVVQELGITGGISYYPETSYRPGYNWMRIILSSSSSYSLKNSAAEESLVWYAIEE